MPDPHASVIHPQVDVNVPAPPRRSLSFRLRDVGVIVTGLPSSAVRARLADLLAPFVVDAPALAGSTAPTVRIGVRPWPGGPGWVVTNSGSRDHRRETDPQGLLSHLEWLVASQSIAASSACVAFHGAALARGDETVLLLANSGAGKTTLTLGLMERGWSPLTDDIVLVNNDTLTIRAFPRCFHVDQSTEALLSDHTLFAQRGRLPGYVSPAQWPAGEHAPTRIFAVQRCETCPSSRSAIMQAEAAGILLAQAIENQLTASQIARVVAGVAGKARGCYRLRNGHLEGALNLIDGVTTK